MATISVQPSGLVFEAKIGESIMDAARAQGLYWPTTCGGQGECTTCLSEIESGAEAVAEMGRYERKKLVAERGEAILRRPVRLACQATIVADGDVRVVKAGVRGAEIS